MMRATKMTSSQCRSVTPPLSRTSSSDLVGRSSDLTRHRNLSPDLSLDFSRHRPLSPDLLDLTLSPDLPRRSRSPARPRSLMETLLVAKMEALSTGKLVRTDSLDSCSSFGSMSSLPSDVCRCDDCLLGIVDFYLPNPDSNKALRKFNPICCIFLYESKVTVIVLRIRRLSFAYLNELYECSVMKHVEFHTQHATPRSASAARTTHARASE
ncbi:unnamed protein product [Danaus chrysippus]|uniref:(African queen) hypothetical protein n=1 Tax=Danaus chrysippus TaxID=151541 RepID=A0A8J2R5J2_9NEOP|nr:unnamed protein product [Danaus chrysippus]